MRLSTRFMKRTTFLALLLFILVSACFFRTVLFTRGMIARTWDWGIPATGTQYEKVLSSQFFVWDDRIYGGLKSTFKNELPFWLLFSPLSPFGGEVVSKVIPLLLIILAGFSMFLLGTKTFRSNWFTAFIAGMFYAYSPFAYSRIIAGHVTMLLGYALLPLLLGFSITFFSYPKRSTIHMLGIFSALLIIATLVSVHLNMAILGIGIVFLGCIYTITEYRSRILSLLTKLVFFGIGFVLLNAFWIVPVVTSYIYERGIYLRPNETVTEEAARRVSYISSQSQSLLGVISYDLPFGLSTEFVYPNSGVGKVFLSLAAILLFGCLLISSGIMKRAKMLIFYAFFLISLLLTTGNTLIPGEVLYGVLLRFVPFIFAGFSNPLRFLPYVFLSAGVILIFCIKHLEVRFVRYLFVVRFLLVFWLILLIQPWLGSAFIRPIVPGDSQPLSLIIAPVHGDSEKIERLLSEQESTNRFVVFPPSFLSWPGQTDQIFPWAAGYYPKPVMFQYLQEPLATALYQQLYTRATSVYLARLLGLGNVETIVYPYYDSFESYYTFRPGIKNYKPLFDANLSVQRNITEFPTTATHTRVWKNEDVLPKIYASEFTTVINTNEALVDAVSLPGYIQRSLIRTESGEETILPYNRLILKPQMVTPPKENAELDALVSPPVRFLPTSPFYWIVKRSESRIYSVSSDPQVREALTLAGKRLAEIRMMLARQPYPYLEVKENILEYERIVRLVAVYIDANGILSEQTAFDIRYVFDHHYRDIQQISAAKEFDGFASELNSTLSLLFDLLQQVEKNIVSRSDPNVLYFSLDNSNAGEYEMWLPDEHSLPESVTINDDFLDITKIQHKEEWVSLGKINMPKGKIRMEMKYKPQQNLWAGFTNQFITDQTIGGDLVEVLKGQPRYMSYLKEISGIIPNRLYRLSFSYKVSDSPARLTIGPILGQNSTHVENTSYYEKILVPENNWRESHLNFYSAVSTTAAVVKLDTNPTEYNIEHYKLKDMNFSEVPEARPVFVRTENIPAITIPTIHFQKVNPARYRVLVSGAVEPFTLVFGESFHSGWQISRRKTTEMSSGSKGLTYFNGQVTEEVPNYSFMDLNFLSGERYEKLPYPLKHFMVNGYANAWLLDQSGSYELELEFVPQRYMYAGLFIAGLSWAICLTLGLIWLIKRQQHE